MGHVRLNGGREDQPFGAGEASGLREYGPVRVRRLLDPPERYDGWRLNQRPPRVGDVGTLIDVFTAAGHADRYVVECCTADGFTVWLAEFLLGELEPAGAEPSRAPSPDQVGEGGFTHGRE